MTRGAPVTAGLFARVVLAALVIAVVSVAVASSVGAESVDVAAILGGGGSDTHRAILFDIRLPRVLAAALVGGVLAVAGTTFQALLRNPLAEPYLLGISGGGAFGAVLAIVAIGATAGALPARVPAAFGGCLVALGVVYAIAVRRGAFHPATLLLAGVVVNAFFLAALAALQYAASPEESQAILRWVMGGFTAPAAAELWLLVAAAVLVLVVVLRDARRLDLLAFGEATARGLGVDVHGTRRRLFVVAALATACSVAVAGPIGFVGLVIPHAVRLVVGSGHRLVVPASFLVGAGFLALADALARVALAPAELPVGIVTAAIGAPAFVALLLRSRARGGALVA